MKNLIGLFVLMVTSTVAFSQTSVVQSTVRDDFEKMTFEADLGKNNYRLFEPIFVKFKFSNQTELPQTTYLPSLVTDTSLLVTSEGKTAKFDRISTAGGGGVRFPSTVNPNWLLTSDEILGTPFVAAFFPAPGKYQVQFVLRAWGGDRTIKSNIIEVTLEEPVGIDKEASDFMTKHKEFFGLSSWTPDCDENQALLEVFVTKYGRSVYGEMAISSLGTFYSSRGEFDKAKAQFEKIRLSENTSIAKEANNSLADIAKREAVEKMKKSDN